MIDRVVVDFVKTFNKPGIFLAVEPKMERANRDDPTSEQVQSKDKNGGLKWTVTIAFAVKSFDRDKYENLSITLVSPTEPCKGIVQGQPVAVEQMEMGVMKQERGGFSQFWSAAAIRPVQVRPVGQ